MTLGILMKGKESSVSLADKLWPNKFTGMSNKMAAILGYVLGETWTEPEIRELHITVDGYLLARYNGDIGCNDFIGSLFNFEQNRDLLFNVSRVTHEEGRLFRKLWLQKVTDWRRKER